MKKVFLITLSFLAIANIKAQSQSYKWGKIDPEYMTMKKYPLDTSAEALVLCDVGSWELNKGDKGWYYVQRVHRQIKIFNKMAMDHYGSVTLRYYYKDQLEYIFDIKAMVTHTDGTQEELKKADFFKEDLDDKYSLIKFTFKGLRVGDIVEYSYNKDSRCIQFLGPWSFQEDVPIVHSEINFTNLAQLEYQFVYNGYLTPKRKNINNGIQFQLDSIPALKKSEPFITTPLDFCASISFQLSRYVQSDGYEKRFLSSWKETARTLETDTDFGHLYLKKKNYDNVWKDIKPLLENAKEEIEKVEIIYNFVNEKVSWNKKFKYWSEKTLDEVYKKGSGTSGEINLMILALLKEANINAVPVLISTWDNGKPFEDYPLMSNFNHVLCEVTLNDKKVLLDGGDKFRPIGLPRNESLSRRGWVIDGTNSMWKTINSNVTKQIRTLSSFTLNQEGTLSGSITLSYQDYAAIEVREDNDKFNNQLKKDLTEIFPDIIIDSIQTQNLNDLKLPLKKTVFCKIPNAALVNADLLYLKPVILSNFAKNPFNETERYFPVEMQYLNKEQSIVNINLPDGFEIETLPQNESLILPENGGKMQFLISEMHKTALQTNFNVQLSKMTYSPEEYQALRSFYRNISAKLNEQIVLKKKS